MAVTQTHAVIVHGNILFPNPEIKQKALMNSLKTHRQMEILFGPFPKFLSPLPSFYNSDKGRR